MDLGIPQGNPGNGQVIVLQSKRRIHNRSIGVAGRSLKIERPSNRPLAGLVDRVDVERVVCKPVAEVGRGIISTEEYAQT